MIRKFSRDELESEPHGVLFKDLYPWEAIDDTPFGCSLAVVQVGGRTMLHSHDPAETFIICRGTGTIAVDEQTHAVAAGDVIYLPPGSIHDLRNDSLAEDLVFVSVFWKTRVAAEPVVAPRLIIPSPPTPSGALHLGHLAGPYLLADVTRRYLGMRGISARLVCLTDDHQSYVADRATAEGVAPHELALRYGDEIARVLEQFHAKPDIHISPSRDPEYRAAVSARFAKLIAGGELVARELDTLYCDDCRLALYDSYVAGDCPHCGAPALGAFCEACNAPNHGADLGGARCDRCRRPASVRPVRRLVFPTAVYRDALADYHRRLRLSPKLRRLAARWLELDFAPAASQVGAWGIPIEGFPGQVISPWFEVALAGSYLRERHSPDGRVSCFFGYDNAYLYLIQDPAVSIALDPAAGLPDELGANEFLLLDDAKMSKSRSHGLDAAAVLARVPADLVRLYLAKVRPEETQTSSSVAVAQLFITMVTRFWQAWLARLGAAIAAETGGRAPAAANASLAPWLHEQQRFLTYLGSLVTRARLGYEAGSLKEVSGAVQELVETAASFGAAQGHLAGVAALAQQRATGLALELAAARTLAMIVAPIMPGFAGQLWSCLGCSGAIEWLDDVAPVHAGQSIALHGVRFFADSFEIGS